jgi:hypothetical protein
MDTIVPILVTVFKTIFWYGRWRHWFDTNLERLFGMFPEEDYLLGNCPKEWQRRQGIIHGRALFAPNFIALRPVLTQRTPRYHSVAQASARLVIHQKSPRPKDVEPISVFEILTNGPAQRRSQLGKGEGCDHAAER